MKIPLSFLLFLFFGFSCTRDQTGFTINGHFTDSKGEKVRLCELGVNEVTPLDSVNISADDHFSFSHKADQPGFYLLVFPDGRRITLVMKTGEHLELEGKLKEPTAKFTVSGSEDSQLLQNFFLATLKNRERVDSLKNVLKSHEGEEDLLKISMSADSVFNIINSDQKKLEKDFIDKYPTSLASLIVLNYSFGPRPVLTMEEDFPYYRKLTGLSPIYPTNKHVVYHLERVKVFENNSPK
jgi:hypothetical protein